MGSTKLSGTAVFDLDWKNGRMVAVNEDDHILRRFGQVDVIMLEPGASLITHRTAGADEIWTLLEGDAVLRLEDLREESPSFHQQMELSISGKAPQAVLIPFGVQARITSPEGGLLLRTTSHADTMFPDDLIFQPAGE